MRTVVSASLKTQLAEQVERVAKDEGVPVSRIISRALEFYLREQSEKKQGGK